MNNYENILKFRWPLSVKRLHKLQQKQKCVAFRNFFLWTWTFNSNTFVFFLFLHMLYFGLQDFSVNNLNKPGSQDLRPPLLALNTIWAPNEQGFGCLCSQFWPKRTLSFKCFKCKKTFCLIVSLKSMRNFQISLSVSEKSFFVIVVNNYTDMVSA